MTEGERGWCMRSTRDDCGTCVARHGANAVRPDRPQRHDAPADAEPTRRRSSPNGLKTGTEKEFSIDGFAGLGNTNLSSTGEAPVVHGVGHHNGPGESDGCSLRKIAALALLARNDTGRTGLVHGACMGRHGRHDGLVESHGGSLRKIAMSPLPQLNMDRAPRDDTGGTGQAR